MSVYQQGLLALHKLNQNGQQRIIVQESSNRHNLKERVLTTVDEGVTSYLSSSEFYVMA